MGNGGRLLIGIDVGTSSCKSTVLTPAGRVVAEAGQGYPTRRRAGGEVSQDPTDWLRAVRVTLAAVTREVDASAVEAIGITAPAHYAVLVDGRGTPLGRCLLSSDARPAKAAARLRTELGERCYATTGVALTAGWTLAQLRWLLDEDPALLRRLRRVLISKDWIRSELTGVEATDPSDAAGTAMYDLRAGSWSPELIEAAGIELEHVPPIQPSTSLGGSLSAAWARRVGLRSGIPVAVGATDTAAELVSVGATEPGDAIVKIASTGTVVVVTDEPRPDPRLLTYPHAIPDRHYGLAATSTAATSDVWLRSAVLAGRAGDEIPRDDARRLAGGVPPGSEGLLFVPFLEGERSPYWDAELRGAFLGLSSSHGRAHLCRAVLEGVAFSLRDCRDAMADAGLPLSDPVLAGGGLRSPLWQRIVVDVFDQPGRHLATQGPSIGAAMLAGAAVGIGGVAGGSRSRRRPGRRIDPDPARARTYDGLFAIYRDAVGSLGELSHRLVRGSAT